MTRGAAATWSGGARGGGAWGGRPRAAWAWLAHPVTVLATVLLVLNDHLLKAAAPEPLTGKLSDVAGLVMAPPLVAVALTTIRVR